MGFMGKTLTALPEKVQQGIDEGWIWKADSAEALAEACGMENLADTLEAYNGYCATGVDEEMFKEAQFLRAVDTDSLYVVELDIAAWVTLGGIKTDGYCRAVDADANPIPGLFVAGVDGRFLGRSLLRGRLGPGLLRGLRVSCRGDGRPGLRIGVVLAAVGLRSSRGRDLRTSADCYRLPTGGRRLRGVRSFARWKSVY